MPRHKGIGYLKQCILAEYGFPLHRISVASDAEVAQLDPGGSPPLFPRAVIGMLIPNPPGATEHILVDTVLRGSIMLIWLTTMCEH